MNINVNLDGSRNYNYRLYNNLDETTRQNVIWEPYHPYIHGLYTQGHPGCMPFRFHVQDHVARYGNAPGGVTSLVTGETIHSVVKSVDSRPRWGPRRC